jgi:signal transduction histidine kinase
MTSTLSLPHHTDPAPGVFRRLAGASVGPWNIAPGDVLLTIVATFLGFMIATGDGVKPAGTTAAGVGMVLIAAPMLARRSAPLAGLAGVFAALLFNMAVFGAHTRCGVVLPITGYLSFVASRRAADRTALLATIGCAAGITALTCAFELGGGGLPVCAMLFAGTIAGGRLVRRRDAVAQDLARHSQALQAQRDQTARLAVENERARIGSDLGAGVEGHIAKLLEHAQTGDLAAFTAIEQESRAGLSNMRAVLDDLSPVTTAPQPTLAELDALLVAKREHASLHFDGERHALAPGVEVAACRIVELLLGAIDPADAGVQVRVRYAGDKVEVDVTGRGSEDSVDAGVLAAARERAAAVGGSIQLRAHRSQTRARVLLPSGA